MLMTASIEKSLHRFFTFGNARMNITTSEIANEIQPPLEYVSVILNREITKTQLMRNVISKFLTVSNLPISSGIRNNKNPAN